MLLSLWLYSCCCSCNNNSIKTFRYTNLIKIKMIGNAAYKRYFIMINRCSLTKNYTVPCITLCTCLYLQIDKIVVKLKVASKSKLGFKHFVWCQVKCLLWIRVPHFIRYVTQSYFKDIKFLFFILYYCQHKYILGNK